MRVDSKRPHGIGRQQFFLIATNPSKFYQKALGLNHLDSLAHPLCVGGLVIHAQDSKRLPRGGLGGGLGYEGPELGEV
jgi:hypothetical protein